MSSPPAPRTAAAQAEGLFDAEIAHRGARDRRVHPPGHHRRDACESQPAFYDPAYAERFPQIDW